MQGRELILFEHNPSPMWMYDIETMEIIDVNEAAIRQYGYSQEEFLQLTICELRPIEEVNELLKHTAKSSFHTGNVGVWKHQTKSGNPFFVELLVQPFDYKTRTVKLVQARVLPEFSQEGQLQQPLYKQLQYHLFNSPLAVMVWDDQLRLQRISEPVSVISGYSSKELQGKSIEELIEQVIAPNDRVNLLRVIRNLTRGTQKRTSFEARLLAKDGSVRYTRWHKSVLTDQHGKLVSVLAMIEDLTSQKELQKSRERMLRTIEATSDFLARIDASGKIQYMNQSARDATGWKRQDIKALPGLKVTDFLSMPHIRQLFEEIVPTLCKKGIWEGQLQIRSNKRKLIPVSAVILAHSEKEDEAEYYSVTCRDISEHLKASRQHQEHQEQLRLAMEGGGIGFWSLYPKRNCLEFDREFLSHMLGYDAHDFSHCPDDWKHLIHPDDLELVSQTFKALCRGQTAYFETEFRLKKADDTWLWMMSRAKVMKRNQDGDPLHISGIHMNIGERKQTEHQLKKALKEQQVLLGEIHHRVKNNLAVVSSLLQLQRLQTDNKDLIRLLTNSEMRIQSLALVHEKLYKTERLSEVNFGNYVQELAEAIKQIHDPRARVNLHIAGSAVKLNINQAVPSALILNEVLLNAFEHGFGENGEGEITIDIECDENKVSIQVCDDGRGLPAGFQKNQEDSLGLLIIETLAYQLEANLVIENNENGQGVCVEFTFEQKIMKGPSSTLTGHLGQKLV